MRAILLVVLVLLLTGCSRAQLLGQGVNHICNMPEEDRVALRYGADRVADPHQVRIQCADEAISEEPDPKTLE